MYEQITLLILLTKNQWNNDTGKRLRGPNRLYGLTISSHHEKISPIDFLKTGFTKINVLIGICLRRRAD